MQNKMTLHFKEAGDHIVLLGTQRNDIGSSEYLHKIKEVAFSPAPYFDLEEEYNLQQLVAGLIKKAVVKSVHDISEGGLIVTLFESAFYANLGFNVNAHDKSIRKDAYWLGESQSRVVVSCNDTQLTAIQNEAAQLGLGCTVIGKVTTGSVNVEGIDWGSIEAWKHIYDTAIEKQLAK
jgi:phosphoribosylformylglycinamidine synthase